MGQWLKNWVIKGSGKRKITFMTALCLALTLHVGLLYLAQILMKGEAIAEKPLPVRPISLAELTAPVPQKRLPAKKKQVVSIPKPIQERRPEKAEFLAEHDSSADKQTISRESSLVSDKITAKVQKGKLAKEDEGGDSARAHKTAPGTRGLIKVPSWKELAGSAGSPFSESVANVEEGAQTRLNSWQWKHAVFFNRIKTRVAANWSPNTQIKRFDPKGAQIGGQDRLTSLRVTIDRRGNMIDVEVISPSGVGYLDDEAVKAFKNAAPFANPPKQLFEEDELFTFEFGFHLSMQLGFGFGFK